MSAPSSTESRDLGALDAVVFPGQGSQRPGMGADFYQQWPVARRTFEEASDATGEDLARLCFEKDARLNLTEFTQPCILTMEIAVYRTAVEVFGLRAGLFGGHSLGEYSALVAAGAMPFAEAVRLVRKRGALMQQAVPAGQGAMAALVADDIQRTGALQLAQEAGAEVANDNSRNQVVISGSAASIERAKVLLTDTLPSVNFIRLQVSAPFHSSLMRSIEAEFRASIHSLAPGLRPTLAASVTSNYTGQFHEPAALVDNLVKQVAGSVRWLDNMHALVGRARNLYELGPGAPLSKFFKTLGAPVTTVTKAAEAEAVLRDYVPPAAPRNSAATTLRDDVPPEALRNGAMATPPWISRAVEDAAVPTSNAPKPPPPRAGPPTSRSTSGAERLGDAAFRRDHGVRLAYVAGAMVKGIASPELVIQMGRAGLLSYFGSGGLSLEDIETGIRRIQAALPHGAPWGVNLLHNVNHPMSEERTVDLVLRLGVRSVEASAYTVLTPAIVRYRLKGARHENGRAIAANRLMAKLSRPEVARQFLAPAPERIVQGLRDKGLITDAEARAAAQLPMADDLCAEADSGGHTDKAVAFSLLPAMLHLRDEAMATFRYPARIRVGTAGGIGTPEAVAASFTMGADFVLTGSINQCTPQADTSGLVKDMLAEADIQDFAMAPAGDMFELGARIQVFRKGVFFPARGNKLYELYQRHASLDDLDASTREQLEKHYFKKSIDAVWAETQAYYSRVDPAQVERTHKHPRHRMALVFRWYFVDTMRRARRGDASDKVNFQIHSGPALGSFNRAVKGTALEDWRNRHVDVLADYLMDNAARLLEERWRRLMSGSATEQVA